MLTLLCLAIDQVQLAAKCARQEPRLRGVLAHMHRLDHVAIVAQLDRGEWHEGPALLGGYLEVLDHTLLVGVLFLRVAVFKDGTESWFRLAARCAATLERLAHVAMQVQLPSFLLVPLISEVVAQVKEAYDTFLAPQHHVPGRIEI